MPRPARLKLQPADPFDLIRWLARSQSDPRKAVAELVQNSIDARAGRVVVERRRLRGAPALSIVDDGEGILPELERGEALRYVATHIGHSRKLSLSPKERYERAVAGKYGVGLLGFWSIGRRMEVRSRVAGSALHVLELVEDEAAVSLSAHAAPLDAPATYTEIVVRELHEAAVRVLTGRRLADFLAAELRGPVLETGVAIEVHDRLARGVAQKRFDVVPRRFEGERLRVDAEVPIAGHPPLRVELYHDRAAPRPAIQVSCAGTLVAEDIAALASLGLDEAPWVGSGLSGVIDFAGFNVPPGSRRGVAPDAAAVAFVSALERLEPQVQAELMRLEEDRRGIADRQLFQELKKALRGLRDRLPHFDLPSSLGGDGDGSAAEGRAGRTAGDDDDDAPEPPVEPELFPPGPLAAVEIVPSVARVAAGRERRVRAVAVDASGRELREELTFAWLVEGPGLSLRGDGPRPAIAAAGEARVGTTGRLRLLASGGGVIRSAEAQVVVEDASETRRDGGYDLPEPDLVDDPAGRWRSRYDGRIWQVNAAHGDYVALRGDSRGRLRYLVALFAKELAARACPVPGAEELLETVLAVIAHAERNLSERQHRGGSPRGAV